MDNCKKNNCAFNMVDSYLKEYIKNYKGELTRENVISEIRKGFPYSDSIGDIQIMVAAGVLNRGN